MPAMENSGGKTAAFAEAKQLLLQCGWYACANNLQIPPFVIPRVIRISEFRYTEVLLYVYYVCIMCEYVCMSMYVCVHVFGERV